MKPDTFKCKLYRKKPLDADVNAEQLYDILDRLRYRPEKFDDIEPLRNTWGNREKFFEQFKANCREPFGIQITKWSKPPFFLHVTWFRGPKAKQHSLSIYGGRYKDFGGDGLPFLLDLADQLFERLGFDYGFACLDAEYHDANINVDVQIDQHTVQPKQVVGMEWPDCIPGLYWCNYFGSVYFEQEFGQRIEEAQYVHRLSNGVRLLRSPSALNWNSSTEVDETERIIQLLGRNWFFSKKTGMPARGLQVDKSLFRL